MTNGIKRSTGARTGQQSPTEQGNISSREVKSPKKGLALSQSLNIYNIDRLCFSPQHDSS